MAQTLREQLESRLAERQSQAAPSEPTGDESTPQPSIDSELESTPDVEAHQSPGENPDASESEDPSGESRDEGAQQEPRRFTPAELAEQIGWEAQDLYDALLLPMGQDGEQIPLGEMKDRVDAARRLQASLEQQQQQLEQEYRNLQQQQAGLVQGLQGPSQEVTSAMARIEQIKSAYANMDWDELRKNGGDVADTKLQFSTALGQAKQQLQQAQVQAQQATQQAQAQAAQWHFQHLAAEPEFREVAQDQEKLQGTLGNLHQFATGVIGFHPSELEGVVHHKAIKTLWYAQKGYEAMQAQQNAAQRLRGAPKPVMRPGGGQPAGRQQRALDETIKRGRRKGASRDEKRAAAKAVFAKSAMRSR